MSEKKFKSILDNITTVIECLPTTFFTINASRLLYKYSKHIEKPALISLFIFWTILLIRLALSLEYIFSSSGKTQELMEYLIILNDDIYYMTFDYLLWLLLYRYKLLEIDMPDEV